jgi:hypothetical protein
MSHLCVLVEEPLFFARLDYRSTDFINVRGVSYKKRAISENDVVFYDWIADDDDVRGLEIHLPLDHPLLRSSVPLNSVSSIETDCFVRIWLSNTRAGVAQGKEAFGDIYFFSTDNNRVAIVVGLQSWLSSSQAASLSKLSFPPER